MLESNFTKINNSLLEFMYSGTLKPNELRVLLVILRNTSGWQRESASLSTSTLSKLTGIDARRVNTALQGLKDKGLISVRKDGKTGVKEIGVCPYGEIRHKAETAIRRKPPQDLGRKSPQVLMAKTAIHIKKEKEIKKEIACAPDGAPNTQADIKSESPETTKREIDDFFEEVWELYPNKKGKASVKDTQRKKLYKIGKEELQRAIDRYLSVLEKDTWRHPKDGSTFFNSGYVDYLDENYQPETKRSGKTSSSSIPASIEKF